MSDALDTEEETTESTESSTSTEQQSTEEQTSEETTTVSIQFVIEDGTCVANANSYVDLATAVQYQTDRNRTAWLSLTEDEQKASLIRATQYVDALYNWKGRRKFESQCLSFPRVEIINSDGFEVNGIPSALKKAVLEASFYGYKAELFTVRTDEAGALKRDKKKVDGAVEVEQEYFSASETFNDYISKYAALDFILKGLYIPKNKKSVNARARWRV